MGGVRPSPILFFQGGSLMNVIGSIGQKMTTDGPVKSSATGKDSRFAQNAKSVSEDALISRGGSEVIDSISKTKADIEADAKELQKLSDLVMGTKLQFNVNKELGSVVVKIVDTSTEQVVKEIPSEDMQKLKLRIRKAIGVLFDQMI